MDKFKKIIKNFFFFLYFLILFYILLDRVYISDLLNIPFYIIPIITFIGFLFICLKYIKLNHKIHQTEYEFTSIVNHAFRTPITSILWSTKEIDKDITINERKTFLQNINISANKIIDILDIFAGIKDIRSTTGYKFEATSIRKIVEDSLMKYGPEIKKKNLDLQVTTFKDIPLLTLDLKKIAFAIDSVIENAIMYSTDNGKILVDSIADKNKVSIYVSDSGIGLNSIEKMRIFSKFYRSKRAVLANPDGMGLKLYLSKIIIKRHSGKIFAKSKGENTGTTLIIELPFNLK